MAATFTIGDPYVKWVTQGPFTFMPRFGDVGLKWLVQPPEVSGLEQQ